MSSNPTLYRIAKLNSDKVKIEYYNDENDANNENKPVFSLEYQLNTALAVGNTSMNALKNWVAAETKNNHEDKQIKSTVKTKELKYATLCHFKVHLSGIILFKQPVG